MSPKAKIIAMGEQSEQLQHVLEVNAARGASLLGSMLDGVRAIINGARMGDPEARKTLVVLRDMAREISALASIELPPSPPPTQG